ncbi:MAG: hypothetical protein ABFS37_01925, partial [Acidobacteriota bacterium]
MSSNVKINYHFHEFTHDSLMEPEPEVLAGVLRERIHHNIEVPLYPVLRKWKGKAIGGFGKEARPTGIDAIWRFIR